MKTKLASQKPLPSWETKPWRVYMVLKLLPCDKALVIIIVISIFCGNLARKVPGAWVSVVRESPPLNSLITLNYVAFHSQYIHYPRWRGCCVLASFSALILLSHSIHILSLCSSSLRIIPPSPLPLLKVSHAHKINMHQRKSFITALLVGASRVSTKTV